MQLHKLTNSVTIFISCDLLIPNFDTAIRFIGLGLLYIRWRDYYNFFLLCNFKNKNVLIFRNLPLCEIKN